MNRFGAFDWFILSGVAVNVVIIVLLVGYWLLHG